MHEMSYVVRVVNLALKKCEEEDIKKVESLTVRIGQMVGVEPFYMEKYYKQAIAGTLLEGSSIRCELIPVKVRCDGCGNEYHPDAGNDYLCPQCGSGAAKLLQGREFVLEEIRAQIK